MRWEVKGFAGAAARLLACRSRRHSDGAFRSVRHLVEGGRTGLVSAGAGPWLRSLPAA